MDRASASLKLLAGSFLACLAVAAGVAPWLAVQPHVMYRVAFGYVVGVPSIALALAAIFVVVSQVKINITNAYAGSIAWSNFFARLTHNHPGRVVWLIFNIAIALLLMELGIYQAIEHTLVMYSTVAAAWVGALVADLVVNKPLGFSPPHIEFKRAHLFDINPVGVGAMAMAVAIGLSAYGGGARVRWRRRFRRSLAFFVRIRNRPADRLGHGWPLLPGAQAARALVEAFDTAVRDMRERFRTGGHGVLPGLLGFDLLAVLFAGCAVRRWLQAGGAVCCASLWRRFRRRCGSR